MLEPVAGARFSSGRERRARTLFNLCLSTTSRPGSSRQWPKNSVEATVKIAASTPMPKRIETINRRGESAAPRSPRGAAHAPRAAGADALPVSTSRTLLMLAIAPVPGLQPGVLWLRQTCARRRAGEHVEMELQLQIEPALDARAVDTSEALRRRCASIRRRTCATDRRCAASSSPRNVLLSWSARTSPAGSASNRPMPSIRSVVLEAVERRERLPRSAARRR